MCCDVYLISSMYCKQLFFMYILNDVNSEYYLESLHSSPLLFFLTVNRRLLYLSIEFTVQYMDLPYRGMLWEEIICRPATCKKNDKFWDKVLVFNFCLWSISKSGSPQVSTTMAPYELQLLNNQQQSFSRLHSLGQSDYRSNVNAIQTVYWILLVLHP